MIEADFCQGFAVGSDQGFLLQTIVDNFPGGISVLDGDLRVVFANQTMRRILDLPDNLFAGGPPHLEEIFRFNARRGEYGPGDVEQQVAERIELAKARKPHAFERQRPDGTTLEVRGVPVEGGGFVTTYVDVTERKQAEVLRDGQAKILQMIAMSSPLEEVLEQLMHLVEAQLAGISSSILLLDKDGIHLRHGAAPSLAEAYTRAIDGICIGPKVGSCGTAVYRKETVIVTDIMSDPLWEDYRDLAAEHSLRSCWSTPILTHDGAVLGTFAMYSATVREPTPIEMRLIDIATRIAGIAIERKHAEDRMHFMANHDALTGLPNRVLFHQRLDEALARLAGNGNIAVLCLDLDQFKHVNDTLGHPIGDLLLKNVADRLSNCLRDTDIAARLGGDEFAVIMPAVDDVRDAAALAGKLIDALGNSYAIKGHEIIVGASVGIAIAPADGASVDALLRNADMALYRAKADGRGRFRFFKPEMDKQAQLRRTLELELRKAFTNGEFELYYQPVVNLKSGEVSGFEALLRWRHPERGMVSPAEFIPLVEEIGLINPLGEWVLRKACTEAMAWPLPVKLAVNLSPVQFKSRNLVQVVLASLAYSRLPAERLELEITESVLLDETDANLATLHQLRAIGVHICMDDFGTGYSSLSYLRSFPFDKIKIDRSFVRELAERPDCMAIVRAVAGLGASLGIATTAEGVETQEQLDRLRAEGFGEMQGYLFSAPQPASEVAKMLRTKPVAKVA